MFLIPTGREPGSSAELRRVLGESLAQTFRLADPEKRVMVEGTWPRLERFAVDLTGATVDPLRPPPAPTRLEAARRTMLLGSRSLLLEADPLFVGHSARLHLCAQATEVDWSLTPDEAGRLWLLPHHFAKGSVRMGMGARDLEHVFLDGATRAAAEHGVTIEEGRLQLEQSGARELRIEAEVTARKLVVKSAILLTGRVGFDEQLNLHFSQMSCTGKGMVGVIACRFLRPHLEAWEQRPLPLLSLAFPGVRLRQAQLETDASGKLIATAELEEGPG